MGTETVTVVFTDLVGSTELLSRVGEERAAELRREHFTLVGDAIEAADGSIVKTMGDGLMAVFTTPSGALDAVVGIQQQAELRNRRATEPFQIRIGVSLGEADAEDNDYFGIPVVEAARLCDAAAGAQVLVTDVVRRWLADVAIMRPRVWGWRAQGSARVRCGVRGRVGRDLSGGDVSGVPLPSPLARRIGVPFVGRDTECAVLMDALKGATSSNPRHVLVSGEAGIGKTTLLTEFATIAHDRGAIVLLAGVTRTSRSPTNRGAKCSPTSIGICRLPSTRTATTSPRCCPMGSPRPTPTQTPLAMSSTARLSTRCVGLLRSGRSS